MSVTPTGGHGKRYTAVLPKHHPAVGVSTNERYRTLNAASHAQGFWVGRVSRNPTVPLGAARWLNRITGDTLKGMESVTVRQLRNNGADVLRRVESGERLVVTRDGTPVAELRPVPRPSPGPAELIRRRKRLPSVDPDALRRDIDTVIDGAL